MVGYCGKDLQKRKVSSLEWKSEGVMDDESGESMEPMEEPMQRKLRTPRTAHIVSLLNSTTSLPPVNLPLSVSDYKWLNNTRCETSD